MNFWIIVEFLFAQIEKQTNLTSSWTNMQIILIERRMYAKWLLAFFRGTPWRTPRQQKEIDN